ncbi:MAG: phenylacetate--CoA ligase family protein [Candidatus Bathyarchaeota archaeon]|nr:MAG: phenylacetate--CoA ligase family protein [Candidatus Bathyarchaeota archaeon]
MAIIVVFERIKTCEVGRMRSLILHGILSMYRKSWEELRCFRDLKKSQWYSLEEIERIQLKKLKGLVKHAYENVQFYHRRFRELGLKPTDVGNLEDLKKLPIVKKENLRHGFPDTLARNYNTRTLEKGTTSGSTGKPFEWYLDKKGFQHNSASYYRFASWYGVNLGDKIVSVTTASPWGARMHQSARVRWGYMLRRVLRLTAYQITEQTLHDFSIILKQFKPKTLRGFTSPIFLISEFLKKEGISDINPSAVITTGETLFDFQRRLIESVFDCNLFNFYGSSEIESIAQECEEHCGLHLNAEERIVEFVRNGENVSSGEEGEIVITDLNNYAMPFIRYNTEDVGIPKSDQCGCGRGLPLIMDVKGRVCDLIVAKNGALISGEFFALPAPYFLKNHKWIQQYQIIQPSREKLLVNIVKSAEPRKQDLEYLVNRIHKHVGDVNVEIRFLESIPTASKHRFTISHVTPELFR